MSFAVTHLVAFIVLLRKQNLRNTSSEISTKKKTKTNGKIPKGQVLFDLFGMHSEKKNNLM